MLIERNPLNPLARLAVARCELEQRHGPLRPEARASALLRHRFRARRHRSSFSSRRRVPRLRRAWRRLAACPPSTSSSPGPRRPVSSTPPEPQLSASQQAAGAQAEPTAASTCRLERSSAPAASSRPSPPTGRLSKPIPASCSSPATASCWVSPRSSTCDRDTGNTRLRRGRAAGLEQAAHAIITRGHGGGALVGDRERKLLPTRVCRRLGLPTSRGWLGHTSGSAVRCSPCARHTSRVPRCLVCALPLRLLQRLPLARRCVLTDSDVATITFSLSSNSDICWMTDWVCAGTPAHPSRERAQWVEVERHRARRPHAPRDFANSVRGKRQACRLLLSALVVWCVTSPSRLASSTSASPRCSSARTCSSPACLSCRSRMPPTTTCARTSQRYTPSQSHTVWRSSSFIGLATSPTIRHLLARQKKIHERGHHVDPDILIDGPDPLPSGSSRGLYFHMLMARRFVLHRLPRQGRHSSPRLVHTLQRDLPDSPAADARRRAASRGRLSGALALILEAAPLVRPVAPVMTVRRPRRAFWLQDIDQLLGGLLGLAWLVLFVTEDIVAWALITDTRPENAWCQERHAAAARGAERPERR